MTLEELMHHTRCALLRDEAIPYLWSDAVLLRFLNQAEVEFAIRTHNIVDDSTAQYTEITTVSGQAVYDLDPAVVAVKQAGRVEYDVTDPENPVEVGYTRLRDRSRNQLRRRFSTGAPCYYTAQVRTNSLRLDPTPDGVYTIELEVARKPSRTLRSPADVPEIEEQYHLALCDYAAYRALHTNDPEGSNAKSAADFKMLWDLTIRDAKRAMAALRAGENARPRTSWTGKG